MIDVALSVLALFAGGLTLEIYAAARDPLGNQDQHGFPLGAEAREPAEPRPSDTPS